MAEINQEAWDAVQAELMALKATIAALLELVVMNSQDPTGSVAAIHSRVTADIAASRIRSGSEERSAMLRERAQERADGLFAAITVRVGHGG